VFCLPFDGVVAKCVAEELTEKLAGGRVEKIYQPEADEILLSVRARSKNFMLVMSASSNYPRIHLTNAAKENPDVPPGFCMLLRKHLSGGRILSFEFNDYERIIGILIEAVDELGDISAKKLVIEIMGRHSNIILVNNENKILDAIKHIDSAISSVREVLPARPYILPPAQNKSSPSGLDTGLLVKNLESSNKTVEKFLLDNIKGFSPLLCREICHRAGIDSGTGASAIGPGAREMLKKALDGVLDDIKNARYAPCILFEDEQHQKPLDFHCLDMEQFKHKIAPGPISETLDAFYSSRDNAERLKQKKADIYKVLNNCIDRCAKKISIHQDTLRDVADREKLRLYGELITANIHAIPRNLSSVSLFNYYSDTQDEYIDIPLDPNLPPQGNAQRYFKKYARAKSAYANTVRQLEESVRELEYLESALQMLDNCTTPGEIDEARQELIEQGYMKLKRKRSIKRRQLLTEPLRFKSSDGLDIYVGKNNKQNDYLTFRLAQSGDIWLHTRNIPGSHVIIKKSGREIPDRTLEEAAVLAAWHSKAKMSANVQVDYTAVKNVAKPPGSKPGMVIYTNYKTAVVTPDKARVESLAQHMLKCTR
jgi:predicted ribosome quality control (RQC) complex YloA/Tae2 family protein